MDLVTVVIPTHDRPALLVQALRSVAAQSWRALDVIVVDDGSQPPVQEVAQVVPGARVLRLDSARGPAAARNLGVARARGEWVLFLDDDDLLHPSHVEALVTGATALPQRAAVSGRWRRFDAGAGTPTFGPVQCCPAAAPRVELLRELFEPLGEGRIWTSSVIWPVEVARAHPWDEDLYTNGDVDFFGRVLLGGCDIAGCEAGMAYYRTHAGERVAGTRSRRALESSTRYRVKWTQLLATHPDRERFAPAMRNALMSLLVSWHQEGDAARIAEVERAWREWGGRRHFVPVPPQQPLKRLLAQAAMRIGGPAALARLLDWNSRLASARAAPAALAAPQDREDAQAVAAFL